MDLASLIVLALKASIVLVVVAVGLGVSVKQAVYLFARPALLVRTILSLFVIMPLVAVALTSVFAFDDAVAVAIVALAVSPVPPLLPQKSLTAGGKPSYTIDVLAAAAVLSIVFVPLSVYLIGRVFERPTYVSTATVVELVTLTVIAPLAVGMIVRAVAPHLAARIARPLAIAALALMVVSALPLVVHAWPQAQSLIGNFSIVAFALFTIAGLAVGHVLGGPDPHNRAVLALSTACRHPAIALSIATANMAAGSPALGAVLLYLIVSFVISGAYVAWRHTHPGAASAAGA
jgi:BASS family bile acid:Na+ symporter